jgi:hypothetical protein
LVHAYNTTSRVNLHVKREEVNFQVITDVETFLNDRLRVECNRKYASKLGSSQEFRKYCEIVNLYRE